MRYLHEVNTHSPVDGTEYAPTFLGCMAEEHSQKPDDAITDRLRLLDYQHAKYASTDLGIEFSFCGAFLAWQTLRDLSILLIPLLISFHLPDTASTATLLNLPQPHYQFPVTSRGALGVAEDRADIAAQSGV